MRTRVWIAPLLGTLSVGLHPSFHGSEECGVRIKHGQMTKSPPNLILFPNTGV